MLVLDPDNADALHWLGVLTFQAHRADQAIPLLEKAAGLRPGDASFMHNVAQAYMACGRINDAVDAFERAIELDTCRGEAHFGLGLALLARKADGDAAEAVAALRRAHEAGLDSAELHYHFGQALLAIGQPEEAVPAFRAALKKNPADPAGYYQLAMAFRLLKEPREVRKCLLRATEIEPFFAPAWYALGMLDLESGRASIAKGLFRRAIQANPDYAPAYRGLGRALQLTGNQQDAMAAFAKALRLSQRRPAPPEPPASLADSLDELEQRMTDPRMTELQYALATQYGIAAPAYIPPNIVANLFNRYAEVFDRHLQGKLQYHLPEVIAERIAAQKLDRPLDILDMGCGTGLCGPLLRPIAATLTGIDLSPAMIDKARERGVYDRLEVMDLVQAMRNHPDSYDLLVAADVLIYIGDLAPAFEAAAHAVRPGGLFIFSSEAGPVGTRYELAPATRRFTHSREYLHHLARIHGFVEMSFEDIIPRIEHEQPVAGYLVVLRWPGEQSRA